MALMHLTFRDALAGRHLNDLCQADKDGKILWDLALDKTEKYWTAIVFHAGSEAEAGATARSIVDLALRTRRQDVLRLACRCMENRWDTSATDVGDLILTVLDAFKNWDHAFDYDLMRSSQSLASRLNDSYPARLREDLLYFLDKYAAVVPQELNETSFERLVYLLDSVSPVVVTSALFSLGRYKFRVPHERDRVARVIESRLVTWPTVLIEQAVATLKDLGDPGSLPVLRDIVRNRKYAARAVAFAANAAAELGVSDDLSLIENLLLDHNFQYRDSASWSLQKLAKRVTAGNIELRSSVLRTYLLALRSESSDVPGRYAKGNILYSLGVLGAREYVSEVEDFVATETEPYVVEDGILALGLLGMASSVPLIRQYLSSSDAAIRLKSAESLELLGVLGKHEVAELIHDQARIVRSFAEEVMARRREAIDPSAARLALAALNRAPVGRRSSRIDFQVSQDERSALETIFQRELAAGRIQVMPTFLDDGSIHEVRVLANDLDSLRRRLGEAVTDD
jgi:HEAT repeat protein